MRRTPFVLIAVVVTLLPGPATADTCDQDLGALACVVGPCAPEYDICDAFVDTGTGNPAWFCAGVNGVCRETPDLTTDPLIKIWLNDVAADRFGVPPVAPIQFRVVFEDAAGNRLGDQAAACTQGTFPIPTGTVRFGVYVPDAASRLTDPACAPSEFVAPRVIRLGARFEY